MPSVLYKKLKNLIKNLPDKKIISDAFLLSKKAHFGQKRRTGEDYITHPLRVAIMLAERKFDTEAVAAALLHDVIEDTDVSQKEIMVQFGPKITQIVDGVTKISNIKNKEVTLNFSNDDDFTFMVDNYRKMLLATAKDIRVIMVKIFDRIDNMQTMEWITGKKRQFYAKESIEIYAQIAERIGLFEAKATLENLAFKYAYPKEYDKFIQIKKQIPNLKDGFITKTVRNIKEILTKNKIKHFDVYGRIKHDYSLYKKLANEYSYDINSIFDLYAFRVIVCSIQDCYKVLGLIHSFYMPIPNRIYDMIAQPKDNGYQSIHTTVKNDNQIFEIQIRTDKMNDVAEYGPAAHWHYKDLINQKNEHLINQSNLEWQKELEAILKEKNHKKFLENLKNEIFTKKIFVFTPKREIIKLPSGSTSIDFAFSIHTNVGLRCAGTKINGRIMPISTILNNGDAVEIILSNKIKPSIDWLNYTKTSQAKQKIRQCLREANRENLIEEGRSYLKSYIEDLGLKTLDQKTLNCRLLESRLPYNKLDEALIALAEKDLPKISLLKVLYPNFNNSQKIKFKIPEQSLYLDSLAGIKHVYAGCCKPKQTDNLIGYVTSEHVIKIHNKNCRFIKKANQNRLIDI